MVEETELKRINDNPELPELWDGKMLFWGKVIRGKMYINDEGIIMNAFLVVHSKEFRNNFKLTDKERLDGTMVVKVPKSEVIDNREDPMFPRIQIMKTFNGEETFLSLKHKELLETIKSQQIRIKSLETRLGVVSYKFKKLAEESHQYITDEVNKYKELGLVSNPQQSNKGTDNQDVFEGAI